VQSGKTITDSLLESKMINEKREHFKLRNYEIEAFCQKHLPFMINRHVYAKGIILLTFFPQNLTILLILKNTVVKAEKNSISQPGKP